MHGTRWLSPRRIGRCRPPPAPLCGHYDGCVRYLSGEHGGCSTRLPFEMARSDRDTQGAEEHQLLRGDAVDSAVEDADGGDREATRNIRHGNTSFFLGI